MHTKAIGVQPDEIDAQTLLANLYTNFNFLDLAMDLYKECLHLKPNSAETYMLLGNAHYMKGEIEQAIGAYKSSINISPENDEYRLWSQLMNGRTQEQKILAINMVKLMFGYLDERTVKGAS